MRQKHFFALILFALISISKTYGNPSSYSLDRDRLIEITNLYITILQKTINQKSDDYLGEMSDCFEDPITNDHTYDLSETDALLKEFVAAYLSDAQESNIIKEISVNFNEIEFINCVYKDDATSKLYTYAKIPKTIFWRDGNRKTVYANYISINITDNNNYFIENVYDDSTLTLEQWILPCKNSTVDSAKELELKKQIDIFYKNVERFYSNKDYLLALNETELILKLNPNYQEAIDAKNSINNLVTEKNIVSQIQNQIRKNSFSDAYTVISMAKKFNYGSNILYKEWKKLITDAQRKQAQDLDFKKAEYYFEKEMYLLALPIYQTLFNENYFRPELRNRIQKCRDADPAIIQKRIKDAYNKAVASKNNAPGTFKTYYKYENSGYLNASNFRFMCQLMLSRGNKRLLREMNISTNQAKNLAIKYFFKAKNAGIDMKDIEFMVFTKNFDKN